MKSFKICLLSITILPLIAGSVFAGTVPPDSTIFPGQTGITLINSLISAYKSTTNLGYDLARDTMYGVIDKDSLDSLECVYSGYKISMIKTGTYVDSTNRAWALHNDINCEHTWPQSLGAENYPPEGDLHHLFPTEMQVNNDRANLPFGDILDNQTNKWYRNNVITTAIPTSNIDQYAELLTNIRFEPREIQKGNTARAMYYFFTMWKSYYIAEDPDSSWWMSQRDELYAWHVDDPADAREIARTKKVATYQQNKPNPFVLDSTLIRRAYFPSLGVGGNPGAYVPDKDRLYQNSPNPFRGHTTIRYELKTKDPATIEIYNLLGQKVNSMALNVQSSGSSKFDWNGTDQAGRMLPPGIYFYRLSVKGKTVDLKRMIMLK